MHLIRLAAGAPSALALSLLLAACGEGTVRVAHDGDVEPLTSFDERSEAAGLTQGLVDGCKAEDLALTYVDDESAERGRLRVWFGGARSPAGTVEVEVQGRAPVTARLADGANELLTAARIQDALGSDGEIAVHVQVQLDCGATVENDFVFEDPIQRCGAPELATIAGHEAQFYECAERWANGGTGCGTSGYLLGYGARYARRFYFDTRPRMTSRGKAWLDNVLVCLQHDLREAIHVDTSCDDLRRTAFDQHPACYAESGFCTLPVWDVLQVPATIDGKDLFSRDGLRQLIGIVPECGKQYQLALGMWLSGRR